MEQKNPIDSLKEKLDVKRNQQAQFQKVVSKYNYALSLIANEIDKLTAALSCEAVSKRKWYHGNEWDAAIADIIAAAGCPLTREEIEDELNAKHLVPDTITNPKQYMYQKILHAQKREVIAGCSISGSRKLYYCLPSWIDETGSFSEAQLASNGLQVC